MEPQLHPKIRPLAFLLGTWRGEGRGEYPTISPFLYGEEVRFWHVGKPFLAYRQRTWALDDGTPLHGEMGYWRLQPVGDVELVLAHPTGVVEVATGALHGTRIAVASTSLGLTPTAKRVDRLERTFEVMDGHLSYTVALAAVGVPLTHHLSARLQRVRPSVAGRQSRASGLPV